MVTSGLPHHPARRGGYDGWRQDTGKRRPQEGGGRRKRPQKRGTQTKREKNLGKRGVRLNRGPRREPRLAAPAPGIARPLNTRATEQRRPPEWCAADCATREVKEATSQEEQ